MVYAAQPNVKCQIRSTGQWIVVQYCILQLVAVAEDPMFVRDGVKMLVAFSPFSTPTAIFRGAVFERAARQKGDMEQHNQAAAHRMKQLLGTRRTIIQANSPQCHQVR